MYATSLLAAGLLAVGANAVYVVSNPVTGQTLYHNDSILFNWTADATTDPEHFRILISNPDNSLLPTNDNPHEIANQVVTADQYFRGQLGNVQNGQDFTITFVNTTNTSQIFAEVKEIKVESGIPSTSTIPPTSQTSTASQNQLPNQKTSTAASTTADPFATTTSATGNNNGAGSNKPVVAAAGVLAVVAAALAL